MRAKSGRELCWLGCAGTLLAFNVSCATIESREVKTVLSERETTVRLYDDIDVVKHRPANETVAFSVTVVDQCTTVTTTQEGHVQEVSRSWVDFGIAGALGATSAGFLGWGLKCHNDPFSCPKGETTSTRTYSGGATQAYVSIGFAVGGAIFAAHAIYKYAKAKDRLSQKTYESAAHACNRRTMSPHGADLVLTSGQRFSTDGERDGDTFVFPGVYAWLIEHPTELDGPAQLSVRGRTYEVAWVELADTAEIRHQAQARKEAIERAEAEIREAIERAVKVRREQAEAEERARTQPLRDATQRLFEASGRALVKCFHPGHDFLDASVNSTRVDGAYGVASGQVRMEFLGVVSWMNAEIMYDPSSNSMLSVPGKKNTLGWNKTNCSLRSWTPIASRDKAAQDAVADFQAKARIVAGVGVAAAAYLLSPEDARKRVANCAREVLVGHVADAAAELFLKDPNVQSAVASVLAHAYKGSVSAADVAHDVAVDAFKRELKRVSPGVSDAYSVGSFLFCAFR